MRESTWLFNWVCMKDMLIWFPNVAPDVTPGPRLWYDYSHSGNCCGFQRYYYTDNQIWNLTVKMNSMGWIAYTSLRHLSCSIMEPDWWWCFLSLGYYETSICLLKLWSWGRLGVCCHQVNHGSDADYQSSDTLWGLHIRTGFCLDAVMAVSRDNS